MARESATQCIRIREAALYRDLLWRDATGFKHLPHCINAYAFNPRCRRGADLAAKQAREMARTEVRPLRESSDIMGLGGIGDNSTLKFL